MLENLPFDRRENEHVSAELNQELQQLYLPVLPFVHEIIELIFGIGSAELYGSIVDGSEVTLSKVSEIIQLMQQHGIALPAYESFQGFRITAEGGWGRKLTQAEIKLLTTP